MNERRGFRFITPPIAISFSRFSICTRVRRRKKSKCNVEPWHVNGIRINFACVDSDSDFTTENESVLPFLSRILNRRRKLRMSLLASSKPAIVSRQNVNAVNRSTSKNTPVRIEPPSHSRHCDLSFRFDSFSVIIPYAFVYPNNPESVVVSPCLL